MKKFIVTSVLLLVFAVCAFAQANKYVVRLKNGIDVECVSYKLTSDNKIEVTYADGSTVILKMDDVEKVTPVTAKAEPVVLQTSRQAQPHVQQNTYNQSGQYNQAAYGVKPAKSPALAGVLSFLIPGVGQFYNGHVGAGIGFLLGGGLSANLMYSAAYNGDAALTTVFACTTLGLWVWGIVHAVQGSKRVNMERGYALGGGKFLNVQPALLNAPTLAANNRYHYGMSFCLTF